MKRKIRKIRKIKDRFRHKRKVKIRIRKILSPHIAMCKSVLTPLRDSMPALPWVDPVYEWRGVAKTE